MLDKTVLHDSADRGIRLVALSLLSDAQKASEQFAHAARKSHATAECDVALHDFRVANRRLRSWLRTFRPSLRDAVAGRHRRRLSAIADATNGARDATVHLEWLHDERRALTGTERVGDTFLRKRLRAEHKGAVDAALAAAADFDTIAAKLHRRLGASLEEAQEHEDAIHFSAVLAEHVREQSDAMREHLAGIREFSDIDAIHRARISAKRLRYLIEPAEEAVSGGGAILETLKELQDALGSLHDVHVFSQELVTAAEEGAAKQAARMLKVINSSDADDERVRGVGARDPVPGLIQLASRLHERGVRTYATVEHDWLKDGAAPFFVRVRVFAATLATWAPSRADARRPRERR
ncbi:MAG: CHAD domain-containing protein [bacterium]